MDSRDARPLPELLAAAGTAAAAVAWPAFDLAFDQAASFGARENRPVVAFGEDGVAGLLAFGQALGEVLRESGLARPKPAWTPHMTLLYDPRPIAEQPIEPIRWRVRDFVLVRSLVGEGRHVELARWPIGS